MRAAVAIVVLANCVNSEYWLGGLVNKVRMGGLVSEVTYRLYKGWNGKQNWLSLRIITIVHSILFCISLSLSLYLLKAQLSLNSATTKHKHNWTLAEFYYKLNSCLEKIPGFRLHLTDIFGLFNFRIWTFGKLQSCISLS